MIKSKYKIYVCHYPPLTARKKYLDSVLPTLEVDYEYSTEYTTYNPEYDHLFSSKKEDFDFKNSFSPTPCNDFKFTNALRALCLEHINIYKKIEDENLDFGIVLEDDAVFVDNIKDRLNETILNLPENWDVIYLTNGCENRSGSFQHGRGNNPTINNFVKMDIPYSWTGGAYIIKKEIAKLYRKHIRPVVFPPDFELNYLQGRFKSNVYWLEDPIVYEGSNPVSGNLYKYGSSVNR
jgi:hypothetical protein